MDEESVKTNKSEKDFNNYLPIALKAIADQISKKFVLIETELNKIEQRIYTLNNKNNSVKNKKQDLSDLIKSEELKGGIIMAPAKKKKNQIEDNELLSALKFIKEGNE